MNGFTSVNGSSTLPASDTVVAPASTKRKREPTMKFYAVRVGKSPGIYHTWPECLEQVKGHPKAEFKSFPLLTDAQAYMNKDSGIGGGASGSGKGGKFYGVQSGRAPAVYTSWPEVLEQITGWKGPKHKVFKTRMEAEIFVAEGQRDHSGAAASTNGDATLESIEFADASTPTKKQKTTTKRTKSGIKDETTSPGPAFAEYEPGEGPLPPDAADDFDPTITLDQNSGTARYKTATELSKTKYQVSGPAAGAPIRIYTDGSALSNGQAAAIGGVGVYFGPLDKRNLSEPLTGTKQTNQRAELTAILRALEVAPRDRKIVIYSDSNYAIKCCTEWFVKWRSNNWHNASNKPVENKDLVLKIVDMLQERLCLNKHRVVDVEDRNEFDPDYEGLGGGYEGGKMGHWERGPASVQFVWVKGHANDEGNAAADELAVNGARTARELGEDVVLD